MRNKKMGRFLMLFMIQTPIMFLGNMIGSIYPVKQNVIMSIFASLLAALLFQPIARLILILKQKYFLKNTTE